MAVTISGTDGISGDLPTIKVSNGTEGAPALTGQDTDSGVFFGTNEVNISTSGTKSLTVNSSGRLSLEGAGQFTHKYTGVSSPILFGQFNSSGDASINNQANAPLLFATNNSERMRVNSYGKILCGAVSPLDYATTNGLEVHSSNNGGALILRNTAATAGKFWRIGPETNNTIVIYSNSGAGQYMTDGGTTWNSNASDLRVKDVVGDLNQTTSWNVLKGLQIKQWWFKNESTEHREANTPHVGPIAQELHALDPNLRLESPGGTTAETFGQDFDGPVYTYDNDLLLKHALSALNQAIAKIETLETKVAALEAAE